MSLESRVVVKRVADTEFHACYFDQSLKGKAKAYWQHTGEIISSRQGIVALKSLGIDPPKFWTDGETAAVEEDDDAWSAVDRTSVMSILKHRILSNALPVLASSKTVETADPLVSITVSGMASIFTALRLVQQSRGVGVVVVFGFPYLDTLKVRC